MYTPGHAATEPLAPQAETSLAPNTLESAATTLTPIISSAAAAQALDSYNYIDAHWVQEMPAADHLSSIAGSYAMGAVGSVLTERLANRLASAGRDNVAERVRRIGNTVTMLGSLACQVVVEASMKGTGDKWDVVSGVVATVPGIIAGKGYAKMGKRARQPSDR